ncbi:hypothetical protein GCM10017566_64780 [Amycolatopsis bartoniae]|uniref:Uncharacterized protein n=1 Tax=Amycolatopsis bartoniae TaxID=941986 RepID=A0A8H9IZG1_9PSEU|nr:hypothetical protein GCM10017566_64780 [Amycolatopsis bartoniae]
MVDGTDFRRVGGRVRVGGEVAPVGQDSHAVRAKGFEVRTAGDEVDLGSRAVEGCAHVRADGSGTENSDFHGVSPILRATLYAVYGMEAVGQRVTQLWTTGPSRAQD